MARARVEIDLGAAGAARHVGDLSRGGLFLAGEELELNAECDVVVFGGATPVVVVARVVFADGSGVGLELRLDPELRAELVARAEAAPDDADTDLAWPEASADLALDEPGWADEVEPEPPAAAADAADAEAAEAAEAAETSTPDPDPPDEDDPDPVRREFARNVYERLRGLTLVAQYKVARAGELHERVALERIYGKNVWEQLLRNPRITPHEVARISRMGNLPRPQLEIIVGNGAWLGVPEVRRALLANPRLTVEMIPRVLRHLPRHELKLVPAQLAYPAAVREAARRILRAAQL